MEPEKKAKGRKKKADEQRKKMHPIYATDAEWVVIEKMAQSENMEVSPFIIKSILS